MKLASRLKTDKRTQELIIRYLEVIKGLLTNLEQI